MLDSIKAEPYLSELKMIRRSGVALTQRMMALAKLFDRLVKSITADERMVFRNFYARFSYLLSTLPMRDLKLRCRHWAEQKILAMWMSWAIIQ
jgi:hypothetical protein